MSWWLWPLVKVCVGLYLLMVLSPFLLFLFLPMANAVPWEMLWHDTQGRTI